MTNVFINAASIPSISADFEYSQLGGVPTEAQLGINKYEVIDNQTPQVADPVNWFIFDHGKSLEGGPSWVDKQNSFLSNTVNFLRYTDPDRFVFKNPGAYINNHVSHNASRSVFVENGGPRNKGYTEISNTTWLRTNTYVPKADSITATTILNQIWKEGSIELTINPTSENCYLLSGNILAPFNFIGSLSGWQEPPGKTTARLNLNNGIVEPGNNTQSQYAEIVLESGIGPGEESGIVTEFTSWFTGQDGRYLASTANVEAGVTLVDQKSMVRAFDVKLVDGKITIVYEIFYGNNKKRVEFSGKTNIVDGNWHHIVINRPSPFTFKSPEERYGDNGCMEIWIDGVLDVRSFEITTSDLLPTPQIIFNNSLNAGILNYRELESVVAGQNNPGDPDEFNTYNPAWINEEIEKDNYVGSIRDYIFRQSLALSPHLIGLNYIYAMLNDDNARTLKAAEAKCTAEMATPSVTVNSKKVLKLYWNELIGTPELMRDGLELDETYQVYAQSVTHKNIINPTETFNLDIVGTKTDRTFVKNVRAAVGKNVHIFRPSLLQTSTSDYAIQPGTTGFVGENLMIDTMDDARAIVEAMPEPWYINNIQFGGVDLVIGDRILLFGQVKPAQNGIYLWNNGDKPLIRVSDIDTNILENAHVYVEQGKYAGKTFVQTEKVTHLRKSKQVWREIDSESSLSTLASYPIHTSPWSDEIGNKRFIDINNDINQDFDVIVFMNYPTQSKYIYSALGGGNDSYNKDRYEEFLSNLKLAVNNGKSLYVSSPILAVDLGIVSGYEEVPQLLNETGDAQSAAISPFESGEAAENYFNTHRNMKYQFCTPTPGLSDKETYIITDFVTYSPNRVDSDYHIKYTYRQFGFQEGDEFYIPGLTTLPETLNPNLPGYRFNQKGIKDLAVFPVNKILMGNCVTRLANTIYDGDDPIQNPYDDYASTIAATYGTGKIFVNCIEDGYAMSRSDYNVGLIQNVTIGQNSETVQTAAWQYSTLRLNKKNLYDFSEITNLIGQTDPTTGGGGGIVQSQSHASNGMIRKNTTKGDLQYQSDLYPDATEEIFEVTEVPVLSMTWLGLKWLAE
jgi:hypothetical protein